MSTTDSANADVYDFSARAYIPDLGTFASLDTVTGSAQNPLTLNRYLYALGNPATMVDPSGHCAIYPNNQETADWCANNPTSKPGDSSPYTPQTAPPDAHPLRPLLAVYGMNQLNFPPLVDNTIRSNPISTPNLRITYEVSNKITLSADLGSPGVSVVTGKPGSDGTELVVGDGSGIKIQGDGTTSVTAGTAKVRVDGRGQLAVGGGGAIPAGSAEGSTSVVCGRGDPGGWFKCERKVVITRETTAEIDGHVYTVTVESTVKTITQVKPPKPSKPSDWSCGMVAAAGITCSTSRSQARGLDPVTQAVWAVNTGGVSMPKWSAYGEEGGATHVGLWVGGLGWYDMPTENVPGGVAAPPVFAPLVPGYGPGVVPGLRLPSWPIQPISMPGLSPI
jgi:RHS repeat-associated protein